ncbi:MAG: hypothetical protein ACOCVM_06810, partial [Desulfovibrionaceae bacterium]
IPYNPEIRADLRSVTKQTTSAGNIRFTAERTPDGHADRFWALALALSAAETGLEIFDYHPVRRRSRDDHHSRPVRCTAGFSRGI